MRETILSFRRAVAPLMVVAMGACGPEADPEADAAHEARNGQRAEIQEELEVYYDALRSGDLDPVSLTLDVVLMTTDGDTVEGEEDVRAFLASTAENVVDIRRHETVIDGAHACSMTEYEWVGEITTPLAICFRLEEGEIAEIRPYFDPSPLR